MSASTKLIAAVLVLLAVVLGVLALFVGRHPPAQNGAAVAAAPPTQTFPVVIASRDLDAGQLVPNDAVRVVQLPVQPPGTYSRIQDVVGHTPRIGVAKGSPLTESGLNQGLPLSLKAGERGLAIPVDEVVGAGNAVQAGDYVDVFFTMKAADNAPAGMVVASQSNDRTVARLLLARLRVLAYGTDSLAPSPAQAATSDANRDLQRQQARTAVLAVPVADVDKLVLATQTGKLTLALRYPEDQQTPDPTLFPEPPRALAARPGLSADKRTLLDSPENRAYAGLDSLGLAGLAQGPSRLSEGAPKAAVPRRPSASLIEVIRGSAVRREPEGAGLGVVQ